MRVLATGGAGFIGSNYVRHRLEHSDDTVVTLDALTYAGSKANLHGVIGHPRHKFVEGDIRDRALVDELLSRADAVLNFAAESHVDRSIQSAEPFVTTNVQGTQTLLDAAVEADLTRFVQISTDEVYGETLDGTFHEDDALAPRNPYAATKAGADLLAASYHTTYGLPVLITRSSNNYGPRQHPEKLVPKLIARARAGEPLPLYGDGTNVREWTYVSDNCRAIDLVLRDGTVGSVYNVGSGEELRNVDVAERILEAFEQPTNLVSFVEDRPGHDKRYALDAGRVRSLGWEPHVPFADGLERTIEYYAGDSGDD